MTKISQKTDVPEGTPPGKRALVHIRELDGVRGIAAMAVFFHHVCFASVTEQGWGGGIRFISHLSHYGSAGVDLFFVLSGFLITSLLIEDRGSSRYYHDFYWKRALRILPLYLICLLGVLAFYPHSGGYVLMSALFVANFAWLFHLDPSGPFWTLAIEEQFYLIWPTVVRRRSIEAISNCAVVIGLSAVILRLIAACWGHHNYQFTFFHCDGLAMGAWLSCRFERWNRLGFRSPRDKVAWAAGLVLAIVLIVLAFHMPAGSRGDAFNAAFFQTAVTLFAGAWIAFLLVHRGKSFLGLFRSRILTFFGLISYAMYMIHRYVMLAYDHFAAPLHAGDVEAYSIRFFAVFGITIALCLLSRYLLELPASSLRKYVLAPASHKVAAAIRSSD